MAPVITAPGDKIFSARSFDIETSMLLEYGMHLMGSGNYVSMQGTSMATPHITGIIALMLQINPNLSYKEIIEIFSTSVTRDEQTGNSPNNIFGYGRIDAYKAIKSTLVATYTESDPEIATEFRLLQNYPNPFNPTTTIGFILPKASDVTLDVYSITGQKVATLISGQLPQGYHDVQFDASMLSTGIYFYRLTSEIGVQTKSMILLK
jgi:subtilisin family serine protease